MRSKVSLPTMTGLRAVQSATMATWFLQSHDWSIVKNKSVEINLFDSSRESTSKRYASNLIKIMSVLSDEQLQIVSSGEDFEQIALLWFGFCKAYPLVGNFAKDVINDHYINKNFILTTSDLWEYFIVKSDENPELKDIGDTSRKKIQSVIFYNLREAGYISNKNELQTARLSNKVLAFINPEGIRFFPFQEVF